MSCRCCMFARNLCQVPKMFCWCVSSRSELEKPQETPEKLGLVTEKQTNVMCAHAPADTFAVKTHMHIPASFHFSGWHTAKSHYCKLLFFSSASSSSPLPLSTSHYHIGQGLLIVPCQRAENGERKGIMAVRREKRGSGRKEGQTGYYAREG